MRRRQRPSTRRFYQSLRIMQCVVHRPTIFSTCTLSQTMSLAYDFDNVLKNLLYYFDYCNMAWPRITTKKSMFPSVATTLCPIFADRLVRLHTTAFFWLQHTGYLWWYPLFHQHWISTVFFCLLLFSSLLLMFMDFDPVWSAFLKLTGHILCPDML